MFGYEFFPSQALTGPLNKLHFQKLPVSFNPIRIFSKFHQYCDYAYLLESMEGPKKLAQYTFIGFNPDLIIKTKNQTVTIQNRKTGEETRERTSNPLSTIKKLLERRFVSFNTFRFVGGAVGYLSYDAVRSWEELPSLAVDDLKFPDLEMGLYDDGLIFDHKKKLVFYHYLTESRLAEVEQLMKEPDIFEPLSLKPLKLNVTRGYFEKAVETAKKYIATGDIFQVVLSKRYDFGLRGDLMGFYRSLRQINPSPYMYVLKLNNRQIVGSSPEMLVRVDNGVVETFPIAGTKPRVDNARVNRQIGAELLSDPKERAEHLMLVDLARNDIGKIAKFGSVHVPEFMRVHQYSHVQHIVSQVVGKLKTDYDCYDVLQAVFPAGTVSGAPKIRAMEIIEELEPVRRGPYAGAVGYFSYNGNADFAITIRTLIASKTNAYIQVGAGIVADSVPKREWFETEQKARALITALHASGDETS